MSNLEELILKIEEMIREEKEKNSDIKYLTTSHAKIIAQIINSYGLSKRENDEIPNAEMIFIGAPTGAGKDTLVRKVMLDNPDKNFVVLNMDMFRYYHNEIKGIHEEISDRDFAISTNQTSFELYHIVQEVILKEFPGTNAIVTGTIRDINWVKEIVRRYKNDEKTDYSISLYTLAVPTNESAFSIFERYLRMVDMRGELSEPLRYTDLSYHDSTIKHFIDNVNSFEMALDDESKESLFGSIRVYRRNKDMFDLSEDTLVYDSENHEKDKSATLAIRDIMLSNVSIDNKRVCEVLDIINKNAEYLENQGLYEEILKGLQGILPQLRKSQEIPSQLISKKDDGNIEV